MKPYLFTLLILTGCGSSIRSTALIESPPRETNCKVEVYAERDRIEKRHRTIGLIEILVGNSAEVGSYIPRLKAEACKLGADGIVLPSSLAFPDFNGQATAIKFEKESK